MIPEKNYVFHSPEVYHVHCPICAWQTDITKEKGFSEITEYVIHTVLKEHLVAKHSIWDMLEFFILERVKI